MPKISRAIAYTRVSTKGQRDHGAGLDLQMTSIHAYAEQLGIEIVDAFSDAHTGAGEESVNNRPGLRKALEKSRSTGYPIIVDHLSRLSRHTDTVDLLVSKEKLDILRARSAYSDERAVMIAEAKRNEAEREHISEATKRALQEAKKRGVKLGNRKNLDEAQKKGAEANRAKAEAFDNELAPVVTEITADRNLSRAEIASELNKRGLTTPRGKPWTAASLRRPLERIKGLEEVRRQEAYEGNPEWGAF